MKNDTLGLYGPEDSKYLRLVARRAEAEGIKTACEIGFVAKSDYCPHCGAKMDGGAEYEAD